MFKLRQRNFLLIVIVLVLTPCIVIIMRMGPELSAEQTLSQRLAECHVRLQYLEAVYRTRQEDVAILTHYLAKQQRTPSSSLVSSSQQPPPPAPPPLLATLPPQQQKHILHNNNINNNSSNNITYNDDLSTIITKTTTTTAIETKKISTSADSANSLLDALSPETRKLISNATNTQLLISSGNRYLLSSKTHVRLPTSYHFLPHLLDDADSLRPAFMQSKLRTDVNIVLGIPTVKREKQNYILRTLQNLIENMSNDEQNETLIVVYIGESKLEDVEIVAKEIMLTFVQYIDDGLIDIIAPDATYYPDFNKTHITLNDSLERVKWRSKQNLDFAYIMAYAQSKGTFYVQLEDDIMAQRNFITTMKQYALQKSALTRHDEQPWFVLDFCQLGFIGKMFRSAELPYLITFFQMFYNDMPVDWLLIHFMNTKLCRIDQDSKHCALERTKQWIHHKPSLFQHIGTSSSLKGKIQKLKDKQFGYQVPTYYAHNNNPPAIVKSNITPYKNFQLKRAYNGETYFWGLLPMPGDMVRFIFEKPIHLRHYLFRSGNTEHPSDRFYNTTVEILPADLILINNNNKNISTTSTITNNNNHYNITNDGFYIVGAFDGMGIAEGKIDQRIGAIKELRLHVRSEPENWVLLSEIELLTDDNDDKIMQHIGRIPMSGS